MTARDAARQPQPPRGRRGDTARREPPPGAQPPAPTHEAERIQALWIAEALAGPVAEALLPRLMQELRAHAPVDRLAYSIDEAADSIGLGRSKVAELVGSGRLPSVKLDGRRLIRIEALSAFLASLEAETAAEFGRAS